MANPKLNDFVQPGQGLHMPAGPTIERGRGCWNCLHWNTDGGKAHWNVRRQGLLALALQHKQGGHADKAKGLAMMIDQTDKAVGQDTFGLCSKGYTTPDCNDAVPLIHYQNLCHMWDGRDGSSVATRGHKIDLLPEELREEFHPKPDPKLIAAAKAEAAAKKAAAALEADRADNAIAVTSTSPAAPSLIIKP